MSEKKMLWLLCFWLFFDLSVWIVTIVFSFSPGCVSVNPYRVLVAAILYLVILAVSFIYMIKNKF